MSLVLSKHNELSTQRHATADNRTEAFFLQESSSREYFEETREYPDAEFAEKSEGGGESERAATARHMAARASISGREDSPKSEFCHKPCEVIT